MSDLITPHLDILRDELNVKDVELTTDVDRFGRKELVLNPKALGPRLGGQMQQVVKAHKAGDWSVDGGTAIVGGVELLDGEFDFRLVSDGGGGAVATLKNTEGLVVLDTDGHRRTRAGGHRPRPDPSDPTGSSGGRPRRQRPDPAGASPAPRTSWHAFEAHRELVMSETLAVEARSEATAPDAETEIVVERAVV